MDSILALIPCLPRTLHNTPAVSRLLTKAGLSQKQPHLTELWEVVLLAERALPEASFIIPYCLVVALSLWAPVGNPSHIADDHFTCGVMEEGKERMKNCRAGQFPPIQGCYSCIKVLEGHPNT